MKLTKKQQREIEILKYFIPKDLFRKLTEQEIKEYFDWSERGSPIIVEQGLYGHGNILALGKEWRDWHIQNYKKHVIEIGLFMFYKAQKDDKDPFPKIVWEFIENSIMIKERPKKHDKCKRT